MAERIASEIASLRRALRALDRAKSLEGIRSIRTAAELTRQRAKLNKSGLEVQNLAAEIKLRAERRAGAILSQLRLRGGDKKSNDHDDCLILADLSVTHNQSTRWQRIAAIPEMILLQYLAIAAETKAEITTKGLLRFATDAQITHHRAERVNSDIAAHGHLSRSDLTLLRPVADTNDEIISELEGQLQHLTTLLTPSCKGRGTKGAPICDETVVPLLSEMRQLVRRPCKKSCVS